MRLDSVLKKLNRKLDRVKIVTRPNTNKLYLRATLPPKPSESKPKQRYLPTGKPANEAGANQANKLAKRLDAELIEARFEWQNWDEKVAKALKPKTIRELAAEIIDRKRPKVLKSGLHSRYIVPFSKLPQDEAPTEALCREVIERECKGYPTKWASYRIAYAALCDLAGVSHNLKALGPRTSSAIKPVSPDDLPSDKTIFEVWEGIKSRAYKIHYARMACYGLRPHESWRCVISDDPEQPFCRVTADTKTGEKTGGRLVLPIPMSWYEVMKPWEDFAPFIRKSGTWRERDNQHLGNLVSRWFLRNMPFNAYTLRHAWACRAASQNLSTGVASRMMGHSNAIHTKIYQQALGKEAQLEAWRKIMQD